ncbi:NAD-specific glutamate dehydrogenase [mine drainage metagenome]|uniref:NAD-specific glutamate dehydrogenase n=4 Tax=mine drainage metagenome TaxID=410659 RepID=T1A4H5_9ZZZZ
MRNGTPSSALPTAFLTKLAASFAKNPPTLGFSEDIRSFLALYFQHLSPVDLDVFTPEDWHALIGQHIEIGLTRTEHETAIRMVNLPARKTASQSYTVALTVNDDMPFLVDSMTLAGREQGLALHLTVHPVMRADRDSTGALRALQGLSASDRDPRESWILMVFDRIHGVERLHLLERAIRHNLGDVARVHEDRTRLGERIEALRDELPHPSTTRIPEREIHEVRDFLTWLTRDWFTPLGYRRYHLAPSGADLELVEDPGSGLGILRRPPDAPRPPAKQLPERVHEKALASELLIITKTNTHSTVHRPGPLDYIGLRRFDERGRVIGEDRILGLFNPLVFKCPPQEIPVVRLKREAILERSGLVPESHAGRRLRVIFDTLPLGELLEASIDQLETLTLGVLSLQERHLTRLFIRPDVFGRYLSCLVYLPRENYTFRARGKIETLLREGLNGQDVESDIWISDSALARLHVTVQTQAPLLSPRHLAALETDIQHAARSWSENFKLALTDRLGEERGLALYERYRESFPAIYQDDVKPQAAVYDLLEIEAIRPDRPLRLSLYRPKHTPAQTLRLKIFRLDQPLAISDTLPILENTGFRVLTEHPYEVGVSTIGRIWIHDFELEPSTSVAPDPTLCKEAIEKLFLAVWDGAAENDAFNRLVLEAGLLWPEVALLRSICKYLVQAGIPFTPVNMARALAGHPAIALLLVRWFKIRFDPARRDDERIQENEKIRAELNQALEQVESSDADRILRAYLGVIGAMLRTSYFQRPLRDSEGYRFLSYKLDSANVPDLPLPRPLYEIFVYAPQVEGIHLRGGRVARGGIRWSDRSEDFRTEVLGLMKAQMVKNTVIVPVGAKGGFYVKQPPKDGSREGVFEEGKRCYRTLIQGLLTLTDNIVAGRVVPPKRTVRYDEDDPYLVVAADKGTATFSDLANGIAADFHFWLGDAFASGGSVGYDHKKMGITARGAWESVRRHFHELGVDPDQEPVTVVGIGDMSGDVFGNGMLLSPHLKLIGAFNHQHIFIDPHPDPQSSFEERRRLFDLPRSSWADYRIDLLSKGGAIYPRSAKQIRPSAEARAALGIESETLTPTELIRGLLTAPVDLLWNGGIGTYVKATSESSADVGDRSNDALRVNGREIRAKVVAEGGNLGFTQLGRVEYALNGGHINTDFIDNSAGVDTSDHEVNIKILLSVASEERHAIVRHRARLLREMTEDIALHVLDHNYEQARALSVLEFRSPQRLEEHVHLIRELERRRIVNRRLEGLPNAETLALRRAAQRGLTRPELAILLAYGKIALSQDLQTSDIAEDPTLCQEIERYFPPALLKRYAPFMHRHPLGRGIITTEITNRLVNHMGPTFVIRIGEETGASTANIVRAFSIAYAVTHASALGRELRALPAKAPPSLTLLPLILSGSLIRHLTRWLIHHDRHQLEVGGRIDYFDSGVQSYEDGLAGMLPEPIQKTYYDRSNDLIAEGAPPQLASRIAAIPFLYPVFDLVEVAQTLNEPLARVAGFHFGLGVALELDWLHGAIETLAVNGSWQAIARISLREELYRQQRRLIVKLIRLAGVEDFMQAFAAWSAAESEALTHFEKLRQEMRSNPNPDYAMLSIAVQELRKLEVPDA